MPMIYYPSKLEPNSLLKIAYEKDDQSPLAFKIGPIWALAQEVNQRRKVAKWVV